MSELSSHVPVGVMKENNDKNTRAEKLETLLFKDGEQRLLVPI